MKKTGFHFLFLLFLSSCSAKDQLPVTVLSVNGVEITAEVADTPDTREKGLMFRKELDEKSGMLFVFEKERQVSFWMKNTYIPLSVAFINKKGVIKEIHHLQPESLNPVGSSYSVKYALEVNQGFFEKYHIRIGDQIEFPAPLLSD